MTSGDARDDAPGREPADADLLRAHVDGDLHAFNELVRRHRDRLWAVALRTIGDREEAADAVQDALLSAHRSAARFRGDSAVTTWLHRIVVNACLDRIRRRQAHPTVPLPDGTHTDDGGLGTRPEPAAPVQDHDTALVVRAALADLPPEQRAALVLVDVQGYPVIEAAEILGVAEGTIKSRCARGRARMALALGHLRIGSEPAGPGGGSSRAAAGGGSRATHAGRRESGGGTSGRDAAGGGTSGRDAAGSGTSGRDAAGSGTSGRDAAGSGTSGRDRAGAGRDAPGRGGAGAGGDASGRGAVGAGGDRANGEAIGGDASSRSAVGEDDDQKRERGGALRDDGHDGNPGAAGRVPSGSGATVPLPSSGPLPASGDRGDQA